MNITTTTTKLYDLTTAWDIALHLYGTDGIADVNLGDNQVAVITFDDGDTLHFDFDVDDNTDGTLRTVGWNWAVYDAEGFATISGGDPIRNRDDVRDVIDAIRTMAAVRATATN